MKPAGGIRTAKQALTFLIAVKEKTGNYQAPYTFSEAPEAY